MRYFNPDNQIKEIKQYKEKREIQLLLDFSFGAVDGT